MCVHHGMPETEIDDDCFHAESTFSSRNAVLNANILCHLRS